jgi:hypothetical protein
MVKNLPPNRIVEQAAANLVQSWFEIEAWTKGVEAANTLFKKFSKSGPIPSSVICKESRNNGTADIAKPPTSSTLLAANTLLRSILHVLGLWRPLRCCRLRIPDKRLRSSSDLRSNIHSMILGKMLSIGVASVCRCRENLRAPAR